MVVTYKSNNAGIIGKEKRANKKLKACYYEKIVELIPIRLKLFG